MSFLATLNINADIKNVRVLAAEYEFSQPVDHTLRPKSRVQCGLISLEIESDNKIGFAQWMLSDTMQHSGEIVFSKRDSGAALKTLSFIDAYCVYYKEVFHATGDIPMTIHLNLSAKEISVNSAKISNPWPEKTRTGTTDAPEITSTPTSEPIRSFNPFE